MLVWVLPIYMHEYIEEKCFIYTYGDSRFKFMAEISLTISPIANENWIFHLVIPKQRLLWIELPDTFQTVLTTEVTKPSYNKAIIFATDFIAL